MSQLQSQADAVPQRMVGHFVEIKWKDASPEVGLIVSASAYDFQVLLADHSLIELEKENFGRLLGRLEFPGLP